MDLRCIGGVPLAGNVLTIDLPQCHLADPNPQATGSRASFAIPDALSAVIWRPKTGGSQLSECADVVAGLQQVRGERVAQHSGGDTHDQVKAFFTGCAKELRGQGDEKGAARLAKASTHWLRHTHASHAIANGMPIEIAQQNLGHASLTTTTVYVKTEEKRRMRAVKKFWQARAGQ